MIEKVNEVIYDVRKLHDRGAVQTVHVNRLKAYYEREMVVNMICCADEGTFAVPLIDLVRDSKKETPLESIEIREGLSPIQKQQTLALLKHHRQEFSNLPSLTNKIMYSIKTTWPLGAPRRAYCAKGEM